MKILLIIFILLSTTIFASGNEAIEQAYAKEFAYLKAQKKMLKQRLNEIETTQKINLDKAKKELSTLQNSVLNRNSKSEKLSDELFRANQNSQVVTDDTSLIESVIMQANSSLKPYNVMINTDTMKYQDSLKNIFSQTDILVSRLSSVVITDGKFYIEDGSEVNGKIIRVGNIATYGVSKDISAALVPAGDSKLKIWNAKEAQESADALLHFDTSKPLNIFIYENSNTEIENVLEKSFIDIINSGGIIGWVIVSLGLVGLLLALFRSIFLFNAGNRTNDLAPYVLQELLTNGASDALTYLKSHKGSTARVLKATVRNLDRDREHIEDIVSEAIMHESGRLDKFGSIILVIAAVSPLLGLLGTVTGMIATFDIITEFGTGDPKLLSGGISIALVTTELGLIVAIPILMLGNILSGWAEKVKDSMEHSALHIINEYSKSK